MRGEILSSVELVLPPNVVETCYNIKRSVQARFRAVNDEEKTKSEISIEKQTDDSVRIHVVVISVKYLSNEELEEENALYEKLDENEPLKSKIQKGRPRRKVRKCVKRKAQRIIRRTPDITEDPKDSQNVDNGKEGLDKEEFGSAAPATATNNLNDELGQDNEIPTSDTNVTSIVHEALEDKVIQQVEKSNSRGVRAPTRKGRGRGRGRGRGTRTLPVERESRIDKSISPSREEKNSGELDLPPKDNISIPTLENKDEIVLVKETSVDQSQSKCQEDAELEDESPSLKERPRRLRRETEESTVSKNSTSPDKPKAKPTLKKAPAKKVRATKARLSGKKGKKPLQSKKAKALKPPIVKEPCESKDEVEGDQDKVPEVPNLRTSLRKRKPILPAESESKTETLNRKAQSVCDAPPIECTVDASTVNNTAEVSTNSLLHKSGNQEDKSERSQKYSQSKAEDDNISIQGKTLDDGEEKAAHQSAETVKAPLRCGRKRGKPQASSEHDPSSEGHLQNKDIDNNPKETPEPLPLQRVKTKAQLKQKPSELSDIDHGQQEFIPCIGKRSRPQPVVNENQISCKLSGKKPPAKSKTLARIWRTRKKSGFTHRKKSKPKHVDTGEEIAETEASGQEKIGNNGIENILENKDDSGEALDVKVESDNGQENTAAQSNSHLCSLDKSNNSDSINTQEDGERHLTHSVANPSNLEDLKLPQKKRHTAKLAAEKNKALYQNQAQDECKRSSETDGDTYKVANKILGPVPDLMTEEEFNETSAIESLIRLSNATEESLNTNRIVDSQYQSNHRHDSTDLSQIEGPPDETTTQEIDAAIKSISEDGPVHEEGNESSDIPLPTSNETIQHLMKIAVGDGKTGKGDDRPGKRAYKREFKVQCRFCSVKVKDYGYLFRHVKKLHRDKGTEMLRHLEEIRPLMRTPCPICRKMVSSISNISSHIKQCHASKDSAVLCPICKKTYKTSVSLRQHLRQCHQPQQHRFFCHMCSANFTEKRSLKEHINCSHETTQIFQCDECGKSFLTKGRLRRHKYIHGEFRHKCKYCGKGFHLKDNMNKHIEIVHEKTHGKRFECPHCDKKFTVKGNMTQHIMGVHLKQFQYTCPQCQTGFRRKKDMLSHMLKHGESGSVSGDSNTINRNNGEEDVTEDSQVNPLDNTWHGSGEKTEVITGLATDAKENGCGGPPRKTQLIVIAPKEDYVD